MKATFGKIATAILFCAMSPFAFAQISVEDFVSNELVDNAENEPQEAIGFVIGQICPSGTIITDSDFQDRCNEVAGGGISDNPTSNDGLQAMAPEEDAVIASSQVDASSGQQNNIGDRQASFRSPAPSGVVYKHNSGFNWSTGAAGDGSSPWGFFVNGLYVNSDRDSTSRESGFESDDWGVTGGIDYAFSEKFIFGLAFGYKNADADVARNGGELETDSVSYFAYWSLYPDQHWFVDAMVGYTDNDHDQVRNVNYTIGGPGTGLGTGSNTINNSAISDTDSEEIAVSVTAGRNFYNGPWTISPYGRIDYGDVEIDGFTERMAQSSALGSGLAVQIDDQDFTSLMLTLGGTATAQWGDKYYPNFTAEYVHEFKNNNDPITGRFVNDSSRTTFTLLTDRPDRNFFNLGVGITAVFTDQVAGFARYQALVGYEDLDVHAVEVGIRVGF